MIIAQESFIDRYEELKPLLYSHWKELGPYQDRMALAPRLQVYKYLDSSGTLVTFTARIDGKLVGYIISNVDWGLHYENTMHSITDVPYVMPEVRHLGVGLKLFLAAEEEFKRRDVGPWYASSKVSSPLHAGMDKLLRKIGMEPMNLQYSKWVS